MLVIPHSQIPSSLTAGIASTTNSLPEPTPVSDLHLGQTSINIASTHSHYFHHRFQSHIPGADFILASSDQPQCWFAIDSQRLFGTAWSAFEKAHRHGRETHQALPVIHLNESRAVLENILLTMDPEAMPDLGQTDFKTIVSTLEIAANKFNLSGVEKLCLLALSLHVESYPIEIFTLALHYSVDWLAKRASPHTLKFDLHDVKCQDILSQESQASLLELHTHRIVEAKRIIRSLTPLVKPICLDCQTDELSAHWMKRSEEMIQKINRPDQPLTQLFNHTVLRPAFYEVTCPSCLDRLLEIGRELEIQWNGVRTHHLSIE
ncbi:hypothetical protein DFH28DRAFT_585277 [Melampsora americana]|nr:hypothetical protein DFH28DRAFT_585277 [Melampsora americana]